jgi:hypothetical protein
MTVSPEPPTPIPESRLPRPEPRIPIPLVVIRMLPNELVYPSSLGEGLTGKLKLIRFFPPY